MTGYQRELTYKHLDHSYSAFGKSDASGSTWLTAFVVKSFAQARPFIFVDDEDLTQSIDWFKSKQLENGCFPEVSDLYMRHLEGDFKMPRFLTAWTRFAQGHERRSCERRFITSHHHLLRGDCYAGGWHSKHSEIPAL